MIIPWIEFLSSLAVLVGKQDMPRVRSLKPDYRFFLQLLSHRIISCDPSPLSISSTINLCNLCFPKIVKYLNIINLFKIMNNNDFSKHFIRTIL